MGKTAQVLTSIGRSLMNWGAQHGGYGSGYGGGAAAWHFRQMFGDLEGDNEYDLSGSSIESICHEYVARKFVQARVTVQNKRDGDGGSKWVDDDASQLLFALNNNPAYDLNHLMAATAIDLMHGNAYWIAGRSASGKAVEWWWMPRQYILVQPREDNIGLPFGYRVTVGNISQLFYPSDVVHFRGFRPDPDNILMSLDPMGPQAPHVDVDNQASKYVGTIMRRLGVPGSIWTAKGETRMSNESVQDMKRYYDAKTKGDQRGSAVVVDAPYDVVFPNVSPENMALDTILRTPEERIPAAFMLNAMALKLGSGMGVATFNNMEEAEQNAFDNGIAPLHTVIAEALTRQLVPEYGGDKTQTRVWFDYSDIPALQEDQDKLHLRVREDYKAGGIDRMTFKTKLGYDADEAKDTDVYAPARGGEAAYSLTDGPPPPPDAPIAAKPKKEKRSALKPLSPDSVLPKFDSDIVHDTIARAEPDTQRLMLANPDDEMKE